MLFRLLPAVRPASQPAQNRIRVRLGNVIEMICDRTGHKTGGVRLQPVEQWQGPLRRHIHFARPRQLGACPFAHQPAHVVIFVACPIRQTRQRLGRPSVQKGTNIELHGKAFGRRMDQIQRALPMILQPVANSENTWHRMDKPSKVIVPQPGIQRGWHRRLDLRRHRRKIRGQVRLKTIGKPVQTLQQRPLRHAAQSRRVKRIPVKPRHSPCIFIRQIT
mmetsp:Transcript_7433/g.12543  ORF Transcript_7433/g.12543 Transcript_7433/m.12543 type:complete len:219 (-) Transcript_7433:2393-3049(-)